ncbi:methyltransferase domain-containing protein [Shewanella sp. JBTF-M18]|uniref:Methyltransferase domain-containing protein n=1 Tax=Shewanella insulae TaxID=2681496 RepID=A0A6L7HYU2_9GAMM|nr:methyltransferase domain-containing protein [Shewanella insulae]
MSLCPLCHSENLACFHRDKHREYKICNRCQLVSVPDAYLLTPEAEKAFYDHHQNDSRDQGYRRFLGRTWLPLRERLTSDHRGLDFGCGPGPTISVMAGEVGIAMENYDLYYFPDEQLLKQQYDFITMTEVIEHVADASALLKRLDAMMKPGTCLAIMTKRVLGEAAFANWHYKQDQTHIRFYSTATFEWIAKAFNWQLEVIDKDVVFFTKLGL